MSKGIYCYLDKKNDRIVYVGKDSNIHKDKRYKEHFYPSSYDDQPFNRILQNNPDRYEYQVLAELSDNFSDNDLKKLERYFIKKFKTYHYKHPDGFNFTRGGDGTSGHKWTEGQKKKVSEKAKERWKDEEYRKKMSKRDKKNSERMKECWKDEEYRKKMSGENNPMYGQTPWNKDIPCSEETKRKISKKLTGRAFSEEHKRKLSEKKKGENHPMYGQTGEKHPAYGRKHTQEECQKISESISKTKNTTGFYRVSKPKDNSCKQGFLWVYKYNKNGKRKFVSSTNLNKLKEKVLEQGLEWKIIDEKKAKKSLRENEVYI